MSLLLAFNSDAPAVSATWTEANLGDDVTGSINELSATEVNITAAGTNDPENGTVAYQLVTSGDIQLICRVPLTWTGTLENFTFFGLQLRESLTGTPVVLQLAAPEIEGGSRAKHRTVTDGAFSSYATGVTSLVRPKYLAITYDDTAKQVKYWESDDGVANNYLQVGATVSITLSFNIFACLWGTSHNNAVTATAALTNCSLGSSITISQAASSPRNIRGHLTWETGSIQPNGTIIDGLFTDGIFIQTLDEDGSARVISNITQSTTPVATYTGTLLIEGQGITLSSVEGMTELEGRLMRVRNPTATTFDVYQDGDDTGYNPTQTTEGNTQTNTSGYGAFSGSCLAQPWKSLNTGQGNPSLPTDADVTVVQTSHTPPTNDVGSANSVPPLIGDFFLSSEIFYWKDNSVVTGNSNKNKPRFSIAIGNGQQFEYNEEEYFSFSIFLPSNYDHEASLEGTLSRNQLMFCNAPDSSSNNNPMEIHLAGDGGDAFDHYMLDYIQGSIASPITNVDLGSTENDVDLWTTFVIRIKNHETSGILEIWKSTGSDIGSGERAMAQVFTRTSGGVGLNPSGSAGFQWNFRQYKFAWHHNANTIDSTVVWIGWDEMRYGGVNEGTEFSDVQPFQQVPP